MIPDMLVVNVFLAVFVTLGPAIFSYSFRRCRISIVYFSLAYQGKLKLKNKAI